MNTHPNMSTSGFFITFEGIDGAGKSTHIGALAQALQGQGRRITQTREPGGTPLAEKLRDLLLHEPMDPLCEALLVFAARRDHLNGVIEPALARGDVVLCDRFTDATFAYQGHGRGFDLGVLAQLERWVQGRVTDGALRQPDLTLWFDLPPATAAARLSLARTADRFEQQPQAFFEAVRQGYAERQAAEPERIVRLDASQTMEAVWADVQAACSARGVLV